MNIQGKVLKVTATTPVGSTQYVKRFIEVSQDDEYNPMIAVELFGEEKCALADNLKEGESISVDINLKSREHNGNYYSSFSVWKFEVGGSATTQPAGVDEDEDKDLPF